MTAWTSADLERFVEKADMFEALPSEIRRKLAGKAKTLTFSADEQVIKRGDEGSSLYVVATGQVRVTLEGPKGNQEVSVLKPGEFFGEIAMMTHAHRTATVTALEDTTLLEFAAGDILPLTEQYQDFKARIARIGAQRSRESLEKLIEE
jgi:CRP-like cAMP-binding protein